MPPKLFVEFARMFSSLKISQRLPRLELLSRYLLVNALPFSTEIVEENIESEIEILFVATGKDFRTLPMAITGALKATNQDAKSTCVIVPDHEVEICNKFLIGSLGLPISVIGESKYVERKNTDLLKNNFEARSGWVLQQILKLEYVRQSRSKGVLIVDSDTVLTKKRGWLDRTGKQLLTPSWEFHTPYFNFLSELPIFEFTEGGFPKFSFVSHHMLMQPKILRDILERCGWIDVDSLVEYLCSLRNLDHNSPFSLDYELYGQYLYMMERKNVVLEKWANSAIQYNKEFNFDLIQESNADFASTSLHTYLD